LYSFFVKQLKSVTLDAKALPRTDGSFVHNQPANEAAMAMDGS